MSISWPKTFVWFFSGLIISSYKDSNWKASGWGETTLSRCGAQLCRAVSGRSCSQAFDPPEPNMLSCGAAFLAQVPLFGNLLFGKLEDIFPHSDSLPSTFPILTLFSPSPSCQVHELKETSVWESLNNEMTPLSVLIHPTLNLYTTPGGSLCFLQF